MKVYATEQNPRGMSCLRLSLPVHCSCADNDEALGSTVPEIGLEELPQDLLMGVYPKTKVGVRWTASNGDAEGR
jgi:hypothetical protein